MNPESSFFGRHKILTGIGIVFLALVALVVVFLGYRMWGPHRSYRLDVVNAGEGEEPGVLQVGVAKYEITPDLERYDTFEDVDNNNKYEPKKGDKPIDRNGNGKFDPIWVAGFGSSRPAKGVHDPLCVRAIALRNNGVTLVMVTIDSIGIFHEKFIDVRKSIDPNLDIDHVMFSSKHIHEVPDTMGIWSGPIPTPWSFNHDYMDMVKFACKRAVEMAVEDLQPAEMICAQVDLDPIESFVDDSRLPTVYDRKLCCARFVEPGTDDTIATMVSWGNHPETLGGGNPYITADFCHYWRLGVEDGVPAPNGVEGLGGMCLYYQGMVGGLMTQLHTTVPHRNGVDKFRDASFEKAQALGENLAIETVKALRGDATWKNENPRLAIAARTVYAPMAGLFKYAITLGLIHPGVWWGFKARSEVNAFRIGDLEILTVPGELYPEIADGGIEAPRGQDFPIGPVEVPPLRKEVMRGRMKMVIGLANDEIGYIVPKSQWDKKPPRAYKEKGQYGEGNSGGPEVAPTLHRESVLLLARLHEAFEAASRADAAAR